MNEERDNTYSDLGTLINVIPDDEKKEWTAPVLTTWTIAEETQQVS